MKALNESKAKEYLKKLKHEHDAWNAKLETLPDDASVNHPIRKMAKYTYERYATALYMYELLTSDGNDF